MEKPLPDDPLLTRWLNGELTQEEKRELEARDDYEDLKKIVEAIENQAQRKSDPVPSYQMTEQQQSPSSVFPLVWMILVMAVIVITAGIIYFTLDKEKPRQFVSGIGEKQVLLLPDSSEVLLNAASSLIYRADKWEETQRKVQLEGEAFFKVRDGKTFRVETNTGVVEVLGTRFNILSREDRFEVDCYSGRIFVVCQDTSELLSSGERVIAGAGNYFIQEKFLPPVAPSWTRGESRFANASVKKIVGELERQYLVSVSFDGPDDKELTVGFPHNNLEAALQLFCRAAEASFEYRNDSTIIIKPD